MSAERRDAGQFHDVGEHQHEQAGGDQSSGLADSGIHLAGEFGVRIEDIVTVTESGGRRLNNTDRHLRVVE
jgi:Xaa-Pro aminopeptidase